MNPFRDSIVASPWEYGGIDVPAIHGSVLEQCVQGVEYVRSRGRSAGLLIHGEAGSGKTHLLKRLRSQLTPAAPTATDRRECLYVWVRLQTSPRMIWRTLRRSLVDDWFRPVSGQRSQFDRILFHRLAEIRIAEGDLEPWYEYMRDEDPQGLSRLMDQIAEAQQLDRNTAVAFQHIAFERHRRDLHAWLAGTSLPAAALDRLEMAQDEGTDEEREDAAREVVVMLCKLAGNDLPIVLSFDQVEALQTTSDDNDALFAFGQLISTLHDSTTNVLLVSSVQSVFATLLKEKSRQADYDRMTSLGSYSLNPLTRSEAEQLIAARLSVDHPAIPPAANRTACWPLDEEEFDQLFTSGRGSVSPRKLLMRCAERFENRLLGTLSPSAKPAAVSPSPEQQVAQFLAATWDTTLEEKQATNTADRTEEIIRHGLPLLMPLVSPTVRHASAETLPDVELIFESPRERIGVSLCTQSNMTSLATRLKRLKGQFDKVKLPRLVVLRDSRVPLSKGAKAAAKNLEELQQKGAAIVYPSVEVLAAIDALRSLLSDAKSGDLSCGTEPVSPQTVAEWLQACLAAPLREFVEEILGEARVDSPEAKADTAVLESLMTLLAEQPMLSVTQAADELQRSVTEIVAFVQRHPQHMGLLGQPPSILFRVESNLPAPHETV